MTQQIVHVRGGFWADPINKKMQSHPMDFYKNLCVDNTQHTKFLVATKALPVSSIYIRNFLNNGES